MKKIMLVLIGFFMTEMCLGGIFSLYVLLRYANFKQGKVFVITLPLLIIAGSGLAAFKCFKALFRYKKTAQKHETVNSPISKISAQPTAEEKQKNVAISSVPIAEINIMQNEVPHLIQVGYEKTLNQEKRTSNIKFDRTERDENLCVQFMTNHGNEIQKHTDSFENMCRLAYSEKDLNKKIELLQKTITIYEKEKNWFYKTKGGRIYFQDFYEHFHNSQNSDFSYIDSVEDELDYYIDKRDVIIPQILSAIGNNGIIQKDIYELVDSDKSDIQKIIRELEAENSIKREKKGNSYLLTLV